MAFTTRICANGWPAAMHELFVLLVLMIFVLIAFPLSEKIKKYCTCMCVLQ
jgi:hypothetical protein